MSKKVLVTDDSPSIVQAACDELEALGYEVEVAYNGSEALERLQTFKPDIIILDIEMPKMRGDEVAEKLRANPEFSSIPLIALTARSADTIGERQVHFDAYLIKPFGFQDMIKIIKEKIGDP